MYIDTFGNLGTYISESRPQHQVSGRNFCVDSEFEVNKKEFCRPGAQK